MNAQSKIKIKYAVNLRKERVEGVQDSRPYIGLEHIESGTGRLIKFIQEDEKLLSELSEGGESLCNLFESDDVLFGKLRPYLAKTWVANFSGRCTTELLVMSPEKVDADFLKYNFLASEFLDAVNSASYGAKMPRADWDFIGDYKILYPPLDTQRRIAAYLDRETAHIDSLIAVKERLLHLLAEKRQALITHAVTRGLNPAVKMKDSGVAWLGEVPEGWEVKKLKYIVTVTGGGTPSKANAEYWKGEIPWVSPKDMKSFWIITTEDYISDAALAESSTKLVPADRVIIVVRSGILRHTLPVGINVLPVALNQDMKALTPMKNQVTPKFLSFTLIGCQSQLLTEWVKQGATVESVEMDVFANTFLPIPSIEEQERIVCFIQNQTSKIDNLMSTTERTITLLKERRSALIATAVTGQIKIPGS